MMFFDKLNPFAFFNYLKRTHQDKPCLLAEINEKNLYLVKHHSYYEILSFKIFICELVYNGINLFPEICEYTITCENEIGTCQFILGNFEVPAEDGLPCMAVYKNLGKQNIKKEDREEPIVCHFELQDIKKIYCNNRHSNVGQDEINTLVMLMYMGGSMPTVSTTSKINKDYFKDKLKIK
uniref:Uncharacterized protein n=1 Tax=viral metagenome TaxID=1070528 RepID=A0A6C0AYE3_9ZZZZ